MAAAPSSALSKISHATCVGNPMRHCEDTVERSSLWVTMEKTTSTTTHPCESKTLQSEGGPLYRSFDLSLETKECKLSLHDATALLFWVAGNVSRTTQSQVVTQVIADAVRRAW